MSFTAETRDASSLVSRENHLRHPFLLIRIPPFSIHVNIFALGVQDLSVPVFTTHIRNPLLFAPILHSLFNLKVAALASGALEVDDLQVLPTKTAEQRPESSEEITSSSEGDDDDSDDTEDDDVHESSHLEDSVKVEMPIPDGASVHTEGASVRSPESTPADMEVDCAHVDAIKCKVEEGTETVGAGAGAESCSSAVANVQGEENNTAGGGGAGTPTVPVEEDNQAEESSSCSDESDG